MTRSAELASCNERRVLLADDSNKFVLPQSETLRRDVVLALHLSCYSCMELSVLLVCKHVGDVTLGAHQSLLALIRTKKSVTILFGVIKK